MQEQVDYMFVETKTHWLQDRLAGKAIHAHAKKAKN
jgi:hypothetical protein